MARRTNPSPEIGAVAAEALAPEANLLSVVDPVDLGGVMRRAVATAVRQPFALAAAGAKFGRGLMSATAHSAALAAGIHTKQVQAAGAKDRRYADPAWRENPYFSWMLQTHSLFEEYVSDLVGVAGLHGSDGEKLAFLQNVVVGATQPNNFLWSNPSALKRAFETGGRSVAKGMLTMAKDVLTNGGYPQQVDTTGFTVGFNMAATPGKVVYRNDLMELIQYEPQTRKVHSVPLVCSPPWINKYYIMDMAPGRSFIEWAVQNGRTVFAISYRNPDPSMRDVTMEDYLVHGPRKALAVVKEITSSDKVDFAAVCLGGTLTAMMLAYLAAIEDDSIGTLTLLNTLVDFSEPGQLGAFTDHTTIERLEAKLQKEGILPADNMRRTFDFLRPNDLIFNYVASNWLMGQDPPSFDILAWNEDSTNMPAAMHSFYLRTCYLDNLFAQGKLDLCGERLDLSQVTADTFIVGAINDHIVPWKASYKTTQILSKADTTYVLSTAGHIAGIVNPPGPKAASWTNEATPPDPQMWFDGAEKEARSWWEIWTEWSGPRAGKMVPARTVGTDDYPALDDAPGTYVLG